MVGASSTEWREDKRRGSGDGIGRTSQTGTGVDDIVMLCLKTEEADGETF